MRSGALFNRSDEFRISPKFTEPVIWVKRLAVVERWGSRADPVLDVEFRRGLNIIATATPGKGERDRVGHDVGKTLLTRLLRYCLGESQYGRKSVRDALQRELPEGYVLAEIVVLGEIWIVARPLAGEPRPASWSWRGVDWDGVLRLEKGEAFSQFTDRLTEVSAARCEQVRLPGRKRAMTWLDMLAWLTRDQHCAYRDPLEWRTKWSDSGSGELDLEDASLIVRLSMDLVNEEEGRLIEERKKALVAKADKSEQLNRKRAKVEQGRDFIVERLSGNEELFDGTLFAEVARKALDAEIRELREKIKGIPNAMGLIDLEAKLRVTDRSVQTTENTLALRRTDRSLAEAELKQHGDSENVEGFDDLFACPLLRTDCSMHADRQGDSERRDYRKELIDNLTRRLADLDQQIATAEEILERAKRQLRQLEAKADVLREAVRKKSQPSLRSIALLEAVKQEAKAHDQRLIDCDKLERQIRGLDKKIENLRQRQREIAIRNGSKLRRLNESIHYVLQFILGKGAEDVIRIGINRLTFATDDDQSSPGEGMATSATLSLDLACLRASLTGLGFLPRFLVHDSPRGGDLEHHLYARMFELVVELEQACMDPPPFQYILATTTQPPKELLKKPYLRLMLDGRDPKQHLLGRRF